MYLRDVVCSPTSFARWRNRPSERMIAVDRNREPHDASGLAIDVVTASDSKQLPTAALDQPRELAAGNCLHMAISRTRPFGSGLALQL